MMRSATPSPTVTVTSLPGRTAGGWLQFLMAVTVSAILTTLMESAPVSYTHLDNVAAAKQCCEEIDKFLQRIGLWIGYSELGVSMEDIREISDCGQVLGDYLNNPRVATIDEMYELLISCYQR